MSLNFITQFMQKNTRFLHIQVHFPVGDNKFFIHNTFILSFYFIFVNSYALFSRTSNPGKISPLINSRAAPPPVEINEKSAFSAF